ncbi:MAG: DUF5989 family protein [Pirellulaceae bacterium]|nr:DUF5989 family protein [Pirellulaceae bacterium]
MAEERTTPATQSSEDFANQVEGESPGIVREFVDFLRFNKKWWLTPIILVLIMVGLLVAFGSSPAAPFIYTLF